MHTQTIAMYDRTENVSFYERNVFHKMSRKHAKCGDPGFSLSERLISPFGLGIPEISSNSNEDVSF